jgi:hypothetical protein
MRVDAHGNYHDEIDFTAPSQNSFASQDSGGNL